MEEPIQDIPRDLDLSSSGVVGSPGAHTAVAVVIPRLPTTIHLLDPVQTTQHNTTPHNTTQQEPATVIRIRFLAATCRARPTMTTLGLPMCEFTPPPPSTDTHTQGETCEILRNSWNNTDNTMQGGCGQ
jgi:hypothetical protein